MIFCFGTVCWGGYLERYVNIFVDNYITIYRKLISLGINHADIVEPKIVCCGDVAGDNVEKAINTLLIATGKQLNIIYDKRKWSTEKIMYSTRNRLRSEFKKAYPNEQKVYFYFPIDDKVRPEIVSEFIKLSKATEPSACMFKFYVNQGGNDFTATTRPIRSYKDIHPKDWGGYCAYTILDEEKCPLYPTIAIPNIAFYAELYRAGYKQYESEKICIEHLRHGDSHHFKFKDAKMSQDVTKFLLKQRADLCEKGYK